MTSGNVDEGAAKHWVWLKSRASCGQGKLSRKRRERVRGSQERRGRDLDGLFPAPSTAATLAAETQPLRRIVILEGILVSIPELFTFFSRVNGGRKFGGWRVEEIALLLNNKQLKILQSSVPLASKFLLFDSLSGVGSLW